MEDNAKCPECGGLRTQKWGFQMSRKRGKIQRYKCLSCGRVFIAPHAEEGGV